MSSTVPTTSQKPFRAGDVIYVGRNEYHAVFGYWEKEVRAASVAESLEVYSVDRDSTPDEVAASIQRGAEVMNPTNADGFAVPFSCVW